MREILFRGKDRTGILNHSWLVGAMDNINEESPKIIRPDRYGNSMFIDVAPETVGQYTGLTDKNGKKIFEGDICQTKGFPLIDDKPFVVEWNSDECSFYWRDVLGTDEFNIGVSQNTTIIGNIHDNPELLKGGASDVD